MDSKNLKISEEYLKELIDFCGRASCGKILKRFEIVPDRTVLKGLVKELIYEGFRNFKDLLEAHNKGLDITQFNIKTKKKKDSTQE